MKLREYVCDIQAPPYIFCSAEPLRADGLGSCGWISIFFLFCSCFGSPNSASSQDLTFLGLSALNLRTHVGASSYRCMPLNLKMRKCQAAFKGLAGWSSN